MFNLNIKSNKLLISSTEKYDNMTAVNILVLNNTDDSYVVDYFLALDNTLESVFSLSVDGYYTIFRILVPNIDKYLNWDVCDFRQRYKSTFILQDNKIMYLARDNFKELKDITKLITTEKTNVILEAQKWFSWIYLELCLLDFILIELNSDYGTCTYNTIHKCSKLNIIDNRFRRDNTLMFLNLIKDCVSCGDYMKALKYLETFYTCFKYCGNSKHHINNCNCYEYFRKTHYRKL